MLSRQFKCHRGVTGGQHCSAYETAGNSGDSTFCINGEAGTAERRERAVTFYVQPETSTFKSN